MRKSLDGGRGDGSSVQVDKRSHAVRGERRHGRSRDLSSCGIDGKHLVGTVSDGSLSGGRDSGHVGRWHVFVVKSLDVVGIRSRAESRGGTLLRHHGSSHEHDSLHVSELVD